METDRNPEKPMESNEFAGSHKLLENLSEIHGIHGNLWKSMQIHGIHGLESVESVESVPEPEAEEEEAAPSPATHAISIGLTAGENVYYEHLIYRVWLKTLSDTTYM